MPTLADGFWHVPGPKDFDSRQVSRDRSGLRGSLCAFDRPWQWLWLLSS